MKKQILTKTDLRDINDAWLQIGYTHDEILNPFDLLTTDDPAIFHKKLTWLMMQPEYFSFICKHVFNIEILPMQALILKELWNRKFPMLIASRGAGKSFILSLYAMIRAFLMPDRKIVIVGAAFRQSKYLYEYMENIWRNAPVLQDLCDTDSGPRSQVDMCRMTINGNTIVALPIGDGSKIRGQRANDIIADEFASMSREIFENVIAGFAAVAANPAAAHKKIMAEIRAEELGYDSRLLQNKADKSMEISNQTVISGTAYYDFNHFSEYWKNWKKIILSKGDQTYISNNVFNGEPVPKSFNWADYSVIRIPVDLVPKGFMDDGQIARSKATVHNGIYLMEFGAVFAKDSQGFFKRSLIESCVAKPENSIIINNDLIRFTSRIKGDVNKKYIMGVDPASEVDNFSIIILELHGTHRRIVHCWTTTRKDHVEKVKAGIVEDNNFYAYCARKIRTLMDLFPIQHIAMDAGGGGIAVYEALHDDKLLKRDSKGGIIEQPIWEVIDDDKEKPSDNQPGLHIIEMCQFSNYAWYSEANHGLRKDFENKVILFPEFDTITIGLSIEEDKHNNRLYDTLEDCVLEIEDLKDELSLIEISASQNGRERWDTPEVKIGVGKKERMRKDRYSSLLMANAAARRLDHELKQQPYHSYGGFAGDHAKKKEKGVVKFDGPSWFTEKMNGVY